MDESSFSGFVSSKPVRSALFSRDEEYDADVVGGLSNGEGFAQGGFPGRD